MKILFRLSLFALCFLLLFGCAPVAKAPPAAPEAPETPEPDPLPPSKLESIPFSGDQLYAAAYLGYEEMTDLAHYADLYLDDETPPVHYISGGEYYLIIPRYADMAVKLYRNDLETSSQTLFYESDCGEPFVLCCNISDIFPDVTVELTHGSDTTAFSPYISLMDGSVEAGDRALLLTRN